jgi:hypothetical protein
VSTEVLAKPINVTGVNGMNLNIIIFLALFFFAVPTVNADYIFAAPPRESEIAGITIYGPLVHKLTQVLGENVVYEQPDNWLEYAKKMRDDDYDIVFDGPHFNAWRMKHLGHTLVASLPGNLQFRLVTDKQYLAVNTTEDLVGRLICGMPSPNLATDMILALYKNPSIQPMIYDVRGGFREMYTKFKKGKCLATIMRVDMFDKLPSPDKQQLKIIVTTRPLPNQTFSVSKRLKSKVAVLTHFFLSEGGSLAGQKILDRYSKGAKRFRPAVKAKFAGAESVLEDVVFGW